MQVTENVSFKDLTTLRLGGKIATLVEIQTPSDIQDFIDQYYDSEKLILGGGSNLVVSDNGYDGVVAKINLKNSSIASQELDRLVRVEAGVVWDEFVEEMVENGFSGLENLSGIPGLVGAAPIQNIGAYGQEVSNLIEYVNVVDLSTGKWRKLDNKELKFGYRTSALKTKEFNAIVESVEFRLKATSVSTLTSYQELASHLAIAPGASASVKDIRKAIIEIRKNKGMVLDYFDHDTWSVGSFFTNPIVSIEKIPAGAVSFSIDEALSKISAAWLIEQAGFTKGFAHKSVAISNKHTLALTNPGMGTTADLLELAKMIQDGVIAKYGIKLDVEPTIIGSEF
jgi:UDP-N-acetylmuramate dehydrogenase